MTLVYFIRHGQSTSNAGERTEYPGSTPLTALGHRQAQLNAASFAETPGLIVCSAYTRTALTAAPLLQRFAPIARAEWPVQEFTYIDPANWMNSTGEERAPAAHSYWERMDPYYNDGGGAESFADLMDRIEETRRLIFAQKNNPLVIFSHGLFTRAFWWRMAQPGLELNSENMRSCAQFIRALNFPNCARLQFQFEAAQTWISPVETAHLPADMITY